MAGYANRLVRLNYPDLSEDGDDIYVVIRNPKTVSLDALTPKDLPTDENGQPDQKAAMAATYAVIASLVRDWHVYDSRDDSESPPPLPLPSTLSEDLAVEAIKGLPVDIVMDISKRLNDVMTPPQ